MDDDDFLVLLDCLREGRGRNDDGGATTASNDDGDGTVAVARWGKRWREVGRLYL